MYVTPLKRIKISRFRENVLAAGTGTQVFWIWNPQNRSTFQQGSVMVARPVVKCAPESAEQRAVLKASYRVAKKEDFKRSL